MSALWNVYDTHLVPSFSRTHVRVIRSPGKIAPNTREKSRSLTATRQGTRRAYVEERPWSVCGKQHRWTLAAVMCFLAACGGPTSPTERAPTGYLFTFTASPSCAALYPLPFQVVLKDFGDDPFGWRRFGSLRSSGSPRDPNLTVSLRNAGAKSVEGRVDGGTITSETPPRSLRFSTQANPFLWPSAPALPFVGDGQLGAVIVADLAGVFLGSSTRPNQPCTADDHRLHFNPLFVKIES